MAHPVSVARFGVLENAGGWMFRPHICLVRGAGSGTAGITGVPPVPPCCAGIQVSKRLSHRVKEEEGPFHLSNESTAKIPNEMIHRTLKFN